MEPAFVYCRAETSFSTLTSQQPFKRQVLAFIRVYPVLSKAFSLLPGYKLECSKGVSARRLKERERKREG